MTEENVICYLVEFDVESFDFISYIIIQMSKKRNKMS